MSHSRSHATCWDLVAEAAEGVDSARSLFARSYLPLIRSYLGERWRETPMLSQLDDAVQEVFVECFREDNPLQRAEPEAGGFRSFLLGIVRNVARRAEERRAAREPAVLTDSVMQQVPAREASLTTMFDREWANMMMREAADLQREQAQGSGREALERVDLLDLRFREGLPIREIALRLQRDPALVHRAYAKAREEFRSCLREVIAFHAVRAQADLDEECRRLLGLLG